MIVKEEEKAFFGINFLTASSLIPGSPRVGGSAGMFTTTKGNT